MSETEAGRGTTRVALGTLLVGAAAFVVLAVVLVPWHPVPGGTPSPVSADSTFTPAQVARAEAFAEPMRLLAWASLAVSLLVASAIGFSSAGRRLMARLPGRWWAQVVLGTLILLLLGRVVTLPLALMQRARLHAAGLSHQSLAGYLRDVGVSVLLDTVATSIVLLVLLGCARRWRTWWPAVAGGVLGVLVLAASFVYPVLVEPLFNSFEPLHHGTLRTEILALADAEGVPVEDVLVADASRRTTTLNAYVSGFGNTRRVVVYDNLVNDLPRSETLAVVGHELAHAKHDDVLVGSLLGAAGTMFAVGLLGMILQSGSVRRRWGPAGSTSLVPLLLALAAWSTLAGAPAQNAISRAIETRADVAALEYTRDPAAFIAVQQQLALRSLADPTPPGWSQFWFGSHPTTLQRIAIAEQLADREVG